ncbi:hypothetical protein BJP36_39815 [Moorena producens JHB]|uniref:Uncharacterized protein n=1 Tax=Moorena producens (strain JHB) TaxID=1454205 RepID=A0A9Q9UWS9_MOOP1|nr:hypothetical protein [Moorena producens]WAN70204.1 hypothetical protein BJP36_39815 [Moorena producens JHB]
MGETTAIASGGNHGNSEWGKPPRPRCIAAPCSANGAGTEAVGDAGRVRKRQEG